MSLFNGRQRAEFGRWLTVGMWFRSCAPDSPHLHGALIITDLSMERDKAETERKGKNRQKIFIYNGLCDSDAR